MIWSQNYGCSTGKRNYQNHVLNHCLTAGKSAITQCNLSAAAGK